MKIREGFILREVAGVFAAVPVEKECTQEQLVKALMEEYDVEEKQAKKDTAAVVGKFREAGILDE